MAKRWRTALVAAATIAATGLPMVAFVDSAAAVTTNTIEDNFGRADQSGWGTTTNDNGLSNVTWGADGAGANASISSKEGIIAYPGSTHIRMATAGSTAFNGGDALAEITMPTVGHVAPYVGLNSCLDTSCAYQARLLTTTNTFQIAKRVSDTLSIPTSTAFTFVAGTAYWVRLNFNSSTNMVSAKIWADGTTEPGSPTLSWTDTGTVLGSNLPSTGASWPSTGTSETVKYDCFSYSSAAATPAAACDTNRMEDNYDRTDQSGLGFSANAGGVSNFTWGSDASGSLWSIGTLKGHLAYPGAINTGKFGSLGSATFANGDELAELSVSDHGAAVPFLLSNMCSDKSCSYQARINTSNNKLEIGRRASSSTVIETSTPFTVIANTDYWVRLNVNNTTGVVRAKAWADGTTEPGFMLSWTDTAPLAAGLPGEGGTWTATGTGQQINWECYAFRSASTLSAKPCQTSTGIVVSAPSVTTGSATGVTQTTATLNGTVTPNGADASWQFEYGTTTSYGTTSPASPGDAGAGFASVPESTNISGLTASTTYHYRLNATNSSGTTHGADKTFTTSSSTQHKVIVIPLENTSRSTAVSNMPYLMTTLAGTYGQATNYKAIAHPSLPNYLAIWGGSTFGVTTDCSVGDVGCVPDPPSVWGQTITAGLSAKAYQEGMTTNCKTGAIAGIYAARHSPWPYWTDTTERADCNSDDVPMGTSSSGNLIDDISNGALPVTGEITPNICDDGHETAAPDTNCPDGTKYFYMERFLQTWIPILQAGPDYTNGNLTIIILMDESTSGDTDFTVPFVVVDPRLHGTSVTASSTYDHYALTKWLEDNAGVTELRNAATAANLKSAFGL